MKRKGQILLETLVAVSALTVGFLGILTLLNNSLSLNRVISDNYTGTGLSVEGIEVVKNILDHDILSIANCNRVTPGSCPVWNTDFPDGRCYEIQFDTTSMPAPVSCSIDAADALNFDTATKLYSYGASPSSVPTSFRRIVRIKRIGSGPQGGDELQVNSIVQWSTRGGGVFSVNLEDHFFNWATASVE